MLRDYQLEPITDQVGGPRVMGKTGLRSKLVDTKKGLICFGLGGSGLS